MRILFIKTSSLGDVIHGLPALTDMAKQMPDLQVDWLVEAPFAEIPLWHPNVNQVIPVATRAWRKHPLKHRKNVLDFIKALRATHYDLIIDAQGLYKSAVMASLAKGKRGGYDGKSIKESYASLLYQSRAGASKSSHAIERIRSLCAQLMNYNVEDKIDYGIDKSQFDDIHINFKTDNNQPYIIFFHATTWETKHWPPSYWQALLKRCVSMGYQVLLPWGNLQEKERAQTIACVDERAIVLDKMSLTEIAALISRAKACVAVDTGLGHLSAALGVPSVHIYGATNSSLTGALGDHQKQLQSDFDCSPCLQKNCQFAQIIQSDDPWPPCYSKINVETVWQQLKQTANL